MNLKLEDFLETAFESVQPTSDKIARVVVEPDYDAEFDPDEAEDLAEQLTDYLQHVAADPKFLASPERYQPEIPAEFQLLRKYIRRVTLYADRVEGPWVEVAPPGNWI